MGSRSETAVVAAHGRMANTHCGRGECIAVTIVEVSSQKEVANSDNKRQRISSRIWHEGNDTTEEGGN